MKHMMKVVIFVSYMICLTSATTNITSSLKYDCTKNGTIRIYSQNATTYGSIYATTDNNSECNVSQPVQNSAGVIFEIRDCNVNKTVNVIIMSDTQVPSKNMVLGGRLVEMHSLQCNGVLVGGVKLHQSITINETEKSPTGFTPHPQPLHNLTLEIRKDGDKVLLTNDIVRIGDQLRLVTSVRTGFVTLVESCNATDNIAQGSHTKNLVSKGHTNDTNVVTDFKVTNNSTSFEMEAQLYAFHFIGTNVVTIVCEITVCESDDTACSFNVTQVSHRIRRHTAILEKTMTLSKTLRVVDRTFEKDDNSDTSAAQRGSEYGFVLMILCAVISATRTRS